ncbi:MAG: DUF3365 domain-containing protein [Nitrosomonadales bacterium]|nr:DUF3365 domain-containing protein [Nitrosomonadales bacterium]
MRHIYTARHIAARIAAIVALSLGGLNTASAGNDQVALDLATLFKSARAVISENQQLINDETKGDKGLSVGKVADMAMQNYKKATGKSFDAADAGSLEGKLMRVMMDSIKEVMDKAQPLINKQGMGFKGFIPAVFGKQVADKFGKGANGLADIKLTAPKVYVRNRANVPDEWENNVIETKFMTAAWEKNKAFSETADHKGKPALRLMIPEYYGSSCLNCHGEPKGELDITGAKKEGAKLNDLGGAISVAIYAK